MGARRAVAVFVVAGLAAAAGILAGGNAPPERVRAQGAPGRGEGRVEIFHTPPGLLLPDEIGVVEFRVACGPGACTGPLTVEVETDGAWSALPVERDTVARPGWYRATLPDFAATLRYRATFDDGERRATRTWTVRRAGFSAVRVGTDALLVAPPALSQVFFSSWGSGPVDVGRAGATPVGPAGFGTLPDGSLVLDDPSADSAVFLAPGGSAVRAKAVLPGETVVGMDAVPGGAVVLVQDRHGIGVRFVPSGSGAADAEPTALLRLPDSIAGQVVAVGAGVEVQGYPSERWYALAVENGELRLTGSHEDMPVVGSPAERARLSVTPEEARLCVTGPEPACYRVTSDWATGVVALVGRLSTGELLVVEAFYRDVPTQESRFALLRLGRHGLSVPVRSLPADDTVEMSAFSRFRLLGDRLYVARPSPRGLDISVMDLLVGR
jgi:hypothetical protein